MFVEEKDGVYKLKVSKYAKKYGKKIGSKVSSVKGKVLSSNPVRAVKTNSFVNSAVKTYNTAKVKDVRGMRKAKKLRGILGF